MVTSAMHTYFMSHLHVLLVNTRNASTERKCSDATKNAQMNSRLSTAKEPLAHALLRVRTSDNRARPRAAVVELELDGSILEELEHVSDLGSSEDGPELRPSPPSWPRRARAFRVARRRD